MKIIKALQGKKSKIILCFSIFLVLFSLSACVTRGQVKLIEQEPEKIVEINEARRIPLRDGELPVTVAAPAVEKSKPAFLQETDGGKKAIQKESRPAAGKNRKIENKAFVVGEKFTFALQYLGITAGTAVIEIKEAVKLKGRKAYHIVTNTKSVPLISAFVKVDDIVETFIDYEGLFSLRMIKSLREGNYNRDVILEYDQDKNEVKEVEKSGEKVYTIADYSQDILSAFFYFRAQNIEVGKEYIIDVYADGKNNKLKVIVPGKEIIKTPLGTYEAFIVKPLLDFESIFKQEGDVTIWMTTDERHIPLLMKSKVFVSSVSAKLIDAVIPK